MNRLALKAFVILMPIITACAETEPVSLLGTWDGPWSSTEGSGRLDVTFSGQEQFGEIEIYSVTITVKGTDCAAEGDFGAGNEGAARLDSEIHFAVRIPGGGPGEGTADFRFDGVIIGSTRLTGTYTLLGESCPSCSCPLGSSGTWTVFR